MPARWLGAREGPRPHVVVRGRLLERIERASAVRLLWIVGEDGLGKSTLVAAYAGRTGRACLWLQLGAADADPGMFISHFAANLRAPGAPSGMAPAHAHDVLAFARRFFSEALTGLPPDTLIVLDGCEHAAGTSIFPLVLREALAVTPAGMQWCLIDGEPACEDFAYLVTLFQGDRIGPTELHVNETEVASLLPAPARGDGALVAQCLQSSAGSIGALQLLASGVLDRAQWPQGGSHPRACFVACAQAFLSQLSETEREALIVLALPEIITADMLDALVRDVGVLRSLRLWARKDLVLQAAADGWRMQPVIRSVVLDMAAAQWNGARLGALSYAMARHCERHARTIEAIQLYSLAGDWGAVGGLVLREAEFEIDGGRWARLRGWIEAMPDAVMEQVPMLRYWLGRALAPLDAELARLCFRRAHLQFERGGDAAGQALSLAGLLDVALTRAAAEAQLPNWVTALDERLEQAQRFPSRALEAGAVRAMVTAALWSTTAPGGLAARARRLHELLVAVELGPDTRLNCAAALLEFYITGGHPDLARRVVEVADGAALVASSGAMARAAWQWAAGLYYFLAGAPDLSAAALDDAVTRAAGEGLHELERRARTCRSMLRILYDQPSAAQEDLAVLRSLARPKELADGAAVAIVAAALARAHGNFDEATRQAAVFMRSASESMPRYTLLLWGVVAADIIIGHGDDGQAQDLVMQLNRRAQHFCHAPWRLAAGLLQAAVQYRRGDMLEWRQSLSQALALYRENPAWALMLRPVCATVARVLGQGLAQGVEPALAEQMIGELGLEAPSRAASDWPWRARLRVLGNVPTVGAPELRTLLGALVAAGTDGVGERVLREALYAGDRLRKSRTLLARALARLQEQLGGVGLIQRASARWRLNAGQCWLDAWAFVELSGSDPARALALYRGPLLPAVDAPGLAAARDALHARYVEVVTAYGQQFELDSQHEAALALYRGAIEIDGACEAFYQGIMRCELESGRVERARQAYDLLAQVLGDQQGAKPSGVTQALLRRLEESSGMSPPPVQNS